MTGWTAEMIMLFADLFDNFDVEGLLFLIFGTTADILVAVSTFCHRKNTKDEFVDFIETLV